MKHQDWGKAHGRWNRSTQSNGELPIVLVGDIAVCEIAVGVISLYPFLLKL
jgi:hypothetical protein